MDAQSAFAIKPPALPTPNNQSLVNLPFIAWRDLALRLSYSPHRDVAAIGIGTTSTGRCQMKELTLRVSLLLSMICLTSSAALADPLHEAVKSGHLDEVKPLIASGADVNAPDNFHNPPLYWAATKGQVAIAEELIAHGANINGKDKSGSTALHAAASAGQVVLLEFLISKGAQVDIKDIDGRTPLHKAAYTGQSGTADVLIADGAMVNARTEDFLTPLFLAVSQGNKEVVELLIARGAKVNVEDVNWAVTMGHTDIVKLLK